MSHRLILRIIERTYPGELVAYGIHRIQQVPKMSEKDREHVFAMLDAFIKQTMSQSVLQ